MRKRFFSMLAVAGVATAVAAGVVFAETVTLGNLTLTVDGGFKPTKLPKKELAPISITAEGHIRTDDGSTPPVADRVVVDFDKNGTVFTKGLSQCDPRKLENTTTATAKRKCKDALVGKGFTSAIVDFPDQEPFEARGPLLAFNGKEQGGDPVIVFHVLANVPLPTTFVVPARISKSPKPGFGKRVDTNVPPIAGGNGTLTDFDVKVKRNYKVKKKGKTKKYSYLLARCANKRFVADAEIFMRDGRVLEIGIVRPCKQEK